MRGTGTGSAAEERGAASSSAEALGPKEYGVDRYEASSEVRAAISRMLRSNGDNPVPPSPDAGAELDAGSGIAALGDLLAIVEQDAEVVEHLALAIVDQIADLRAWLETG